MSDFKYKVAKSGKITAFRGKAELSALWLEEDPPLTHRKVLRGAIEPVWVRAAWACYGRRCLPADLNTLLEHKKVVLQVMADSPRLLAPILGCVSDGSLKATPHHSLVQRFKALLRKDGYTPRTNFLVSTKDPLNRKKDSDVTRFWEWHKNAEPLTEGGWRFLLTLPYGTIREFFSKGYVVPKHLGTLNRLSQLDLRNLSKGALSVALNGCNSVQASPDTIKALLLSLREVTSMDKATLHRQADLVSDWLRGERPEINPGTSWQTMVSNAVSFALVQAEMSRKDLKELTWSSPVEAFVATDGLVVRPLVNGSELVDEGQAMRNCLRSLRFYAHEAVKGKSQVFSISGLAGRATVEFTRTNTEDAWALKQAEEANNQPIKGQALARAVKQLETKMREAA
jgi:hypothetical protein